MPGDLYLAGRGLARGYLHRPGPTAASFIACPFAQAASACTGRGTWPGGRPTAGLEFLGRADDQVKIRGFRLKPAEVERALATHPSVGQAAVVRRADTPGGPGLAGYVVPAEVGGTVEPTALRDHVAALLPDFMVPASLTVVTELPLTANGKLDRGALPAPAPMASRRGRAPEGADEQALCALFGAILGVPEVSADDNFFALGGHSMLAVRLVSRVRSELGADVSVRTLFEAPTVAGLAAVLRTGPGPDPLAGLLPLRSAGGRPPLFCVHPGGGLSWCYAALPEQLDPEVPVYGLQARGLHDGEELPASIGEMAAGYLEQIRTVQPQGPYHLAGWCFGGSVAHQLATQLQAAGDEVALLALVDAAPSNTPPDGRRIATPADLLMSEQQLLREVLNGLDVNLPGLDGQDLDQATTLAIIREQSGQAGGLAEDSILALIRVLRNNIWMSVDFEPDLFHGSLLYFAATIDGLPAARWAPYLTGQMEVHEVAAKHDHMTHATAVAEIGRVIGAKLAAGTGNG